MLSARPTIRNVSDRARNWTPQQLRQAGPSSLIGRDDDVLRQRIVKLKTLDFAKGLGRSSPATIKAVQLSARTAGKYRSANGTAPRFPTSRPPPRAPLPWPGSRSAPKPGPERTTRPLLDHRTGHHGGPRPVRPRAPPADILDGRHDRDGAIPCQLDGGLKCFGHPVGASGLRIACEGYNQLQGRAGERPRGTADLGLMHNLGGSPFNSVAAVAVFGRLN